MIGAGSLDLVPIILIRINSLDFSNPNIIFCGIII